MEVFYIYGCGDNQDGDHSAFNQPIRQIVRQKMNSLSAPVSMPVHVTGTESKAFHSGLTLPTTSFMIEQVRLITARELMQKEQQHMVEFRDHEEVNLREELESIRPENGAMRNSVAGKMRHNDKCVEELNRYCENAIARGSFCPEGIMNAAIETLNLSLLKPADVLQFVQNSHEVLPPFSFFYCQHPDFLEPRYPGDSRHIIQVVVQLTSTKVVLETLRQGALSQVPVDMPLAFYDELPWEV